MTTKAAALAIRKGEQKGAIAEKKAAHERVFNLLFFLHTLLCAVNQKSGCSARASCRVQSTPSERKPQPQTRACPSRIHIYVRLTTAAVAHSVRTVACVVGEIVEAFFFHKDFR
jgi:hypothetical protein